MIIRTAAEFLDTTTHWPDRLISVDFETNGLPPHHPASRLVSVALAPYEDPLLTPFEVIPALVIPLAMRGRNADPAILEPLLTFLSTAPLLAWSLPMEATWVYTKWRQAWRWVQDPSIGARLLRWSSASLKECIATKLPHVQPIPLSRLLGSENFDFSRLDPDDPAVDAYQTQDVIAPLQIFHLMRAEMSPRTQTAYRLEVDAAVRMAHQQARGYLVDQTTLLAHRRNEETAMRNLEHDIYRGLGKRILLTSQPQVTEAITALGIESPRTTSAGKPSWSKEAIELMADRHPVLKQIGDWRQKHAFSEASRRYAETFVDGRVFPRWWMLGDTGDAVPDSQGPSFQFLPRELRRMFVAPPGRVWHGLWYDSFLLRAFGHLAHDAAARSVALPPPEAMGGLDPYKTLLRWVYLGDVSVLAASGGLDVAVVQRAVDAYTAAFPALAAFLDALPQMHDVELYGRTYVLHETEPHRRRSEIVTFTLRTLAGTLLKQTLCWLPAEAEDLIVQQEALAFTLPADQAPPAVDEASTLTPYAWTPRALTGPTWYDASPRPELL